MISIHAPLAGCDLGLPINAISNIKFQSTHPLRGATHIIQGYVTHGWISIHAPLAGCDKQKEE